jgi:hypothetical protein
MQNNVLKLFVEALASYRREHSGSMFRWSSRPMKALIDLADKEAIRDTAG